ncbi:MAG: transposase, partial [Pirellulaceae bacterium]
MQDAEETELTPPQRPGSTTDVDQRRRRCGEERFTARSKSKQQRKNRSNANRSSSSSSSSKSSKNNRVSAKSKVTSEPPRRIKISGDEFVRRWSLHVLPKGFTRSRCYGGFHGSRRKAYLQACRKLLPAAAVDATTVEDSAKSNPPDDSPTAQPKCPRCQIEMDCIADLTRPSWKNLLGPNHAHPRK